MTTVGIDIGGSKTAMGLFEGIQLVEAFSIPTTDFDKTIVEIREISAKWGTHSIQAVGVGCTGPLDLVHGTVLNDETLTGWLDRPITRSVQKIFNAPAILLNDADTALVGELFSDDRTYAASTLMLTFGTGVGGGFWDGDRIYQGAFGEHPEIGHILVDPSGPLCYCGLKGCLESLVSGPALNSSAIHHGFEGIEQLSQKADEGNADALALLGKARGSISDALISLTHAFRPTAYILGGGVMEKMSRFLCPSHVPVNKSTVPGDPPTIRLAKLGNHAGMYGASVAVRRQFL